MESPSWDSIPLLALKCIIENLEEKDALAATSTCRHWRSSLLMYEGRRDVLRLPVLDIEKCDYLVRLFKKHTQRLHIIIKGDMSEEFNTFMCYILPQFLDSINLQEIVFIGSLYAHLNRMPYTQLRRVITETLVYKHAHVLETFAIFGCELNIIDENDRFVDSQMEYYSKSLSFKQALPLAQSLRENSVLSRTNVELMMFSNLKHIVIEYDLLSTDALVTLSKLDNFKMLSLNFMSKKAVTYQQIDWAAVKPLFSKGLEVAVNLIYLTESRLKYILNNTFCSEMPVTSVKALYLRNFYMDVIMHVTSKYASNLTEFIWADPPTPVDSHKRAIPIEYGEAVRSPYNHVNPFIFLSWQCSQLQKLVIHGYWICEYDLLGVTRLRPGIDLVVSSIYDSTVYLFEHRESPMLRGHLMRVMTTDGPPRVTSANKNVLKYWYYRRKGRLHSSDLSRSKCVNKNWAVSRKIYMSRLNNVQTEQLTPKDWKDLPEALKVGATTAQKSEYIVGEILQPWGIT